uniref:Polynucleotide adenylyltransferase n=1 Tax=Noctiluca scintillans TaxID=2966 RepID=A0A7S1AMA7_NOCSC
MEGVLASQAPPMRMPDGFPQLPAQGFAVPPDGAPASAKDRRIIEALAAPERTHRRLLQAARQVPEILMDPEERALAVNVELYGSLTLDMEPELKDARWHQEWASYYVTKTSDVDYVVELGPNIPPSLVMHRLVEAGPWRVVGETTVHKFATTQYSLLGSFDEDEESAEVFLDVTCIMEPVHFQRFKRRQDEFRQVFVKTREMMQARYGAQGALGFDAYIHLLKAFAAKVPASALGGFQSVCIGLFTLQRGHFLLKPNQSIASSLFEGFLSFCVSYYGEPPASPSVPWHSVNFRRCAIDLSDGGRLMPRMGHSWRSELYFAAAEAETRWDERVNVAHSLDPLRVSMEARSLLHRVFALASS